MKEYQRLTKRTTTDENNKNWYGTEVSRVTILNRLGELEDKIENGTLIELPCKVGDTIYIAWVWKGSSGVATVNVERISIEVDNAFTVFTDIESDDSDYLIEYAFLFRNDFGKKAFLKKAEAEERLKELKGEL